MNEIKVLNTSIQLMNIFYKHFKDGFIVNGRNTFELLHPFTNINDLIENNKLNINNVSQTSFILSNVLNKFEFFLDKKRDILYEELHNMGFIKVNKFFCKDDTLESAFLNYLNSDKYKEHKTINVYKFLYKDNNVQELRKEVINNINNLGKLIYLDKAPKLPKINNNYILYELAQKSCVEGVQNLYMFHFLNNKNMFVVSNKLGIRSYEIYVNWKHNNSSKDKLIKYLNKSELKMIIQENNEDIDNTFKELLSFIDNYKYYITLRINNYQRIKEMK